MREILYRGKCINDDDICICGWADGYYVRLRDPFKKRDSHRIYTGFAECDCGDFYGDWYEVDPKTVCQFTGLFDKNGERIYEGDILDHIIQKDVLTNRGVVVWDGENARWALQLNTMKPCFYMYNPETVEIVGNIYDNPELLR